MPRFQTGRAPPSAKLTPEQVVEIRRLYFQEHWTQARLARRFQITIGTVGRIVRGETWQGRAGAPGTSFDQSKPLDQQVAESQARLEQMIDMQEKEPEIPDILKPKKPNPYF